MTFLPSRTKRRKQWQRPSALPLESAKATLVAGGTRNFEAYDAFLGARSLRYKEGRANYTGAIELFEKAVRLDPEFANAWGELASVYNLAAQAFISEKAEELTSKFKEATARAVEIAPDSVAGLRAAAMGQWLINRVWQSAERQLKRAIDLAPADYSVTSEYGYFLLNVGRPRDALQYYQRAFKLEPLAVNAARTVAHGYEISGDLDQALKQFRLAETLPGEHLLVHGPMMATAMAMGDHALVKELSAKLLDTDSMPPANKDLTRTMHSLLDSPAAAIAELRRMHQDPAFDDPLTHMVIPIYASYFGDHDLALEAYQAGSKSGLFSPLLMWRPIHKEMRRFPGFKDLVRDLGLVDYWRASGNWGDFCRPISDDDFECE